MRVKSFLVASCSLQILALSYIASFDWAPGLIKFSQVFWFCLNIDRWQQIMIYFRRAECQFPDSRYPQDGSVGQKSFHRFLAEIFVHRASAAPADDGWPSRSPTSAEINASFNIVFPETLEERNSMSRLLNHAQYDGGGFRLIHQ